MQTLRPVTKPSKQRKMLYEAPAHIRHKLLAAHLSPQLRGTHLVKSLAVRSGDTVRVTRGDHKGFEGKISRIDLKEYRIYLEGLTREKVDGTTVFVPVHPSKVMVTRLNLDDKWRKKILERKQKAQTKKKEAVQKPELEAVQKPELEAVQKPELEAVQKPEETAELKEPFKEKVAAVKKPRKKKVAKRPKRARKATAEKKGAEAEKAEKEPKPSAEKKRGKRKAAKKIEQGEA